MPNSNRWVTGWGSAGIFVVALVARLLWISTLHNEIRWIDEQDFASIARHLTAGDGYVSSSFRANPTIPAYLAVIFHVFGENYTAARVGQALMGAAACVLIGRIAATLIGPIAGLMSGAALALYPPHIFLSGVFYVDSWLTFLCAVTVYLTLRTTRNAGRPYAALLCGVSEGLTILTRPAFIAFLPGPLLAWGVSLALSRRRRAVLCVLYLLGCFVTVLPWTYRNYQTFGRPMLVASGFWAMLWRGNNELANGGPEDRLLDWNTPWWNERLQRLSTARQEELARRYEAVDRLVVDRGRVVGDAALAMDDVLKPLAIDAVLSHPLRTLRLIAAKTGTLYSAFSETATGNDSSIPLRRWIAPLSFYPLLVLALIGATVGANNWRALLPVYFLIASITGVYALLTACTRFRLPLDPFLIVLASLAVTRLAPVFWRSRAMYGPVVASGNGPARAAGRFWERALLRLDGTATPASSEDSRHA